MSVIVLDRCCGSSSWEPGSAEAGRELVKKELICMWGWRHALVQQEERSQKQLGMAGTRWKQGMWELQLHMVFNSKSH